MKHKKGKSQTVKLNFHPNNKHQGRYDLIALGKVCPELSSYLITNSFGNKSINFFNPLAVKALNKALLKKYYDINWDLAEGYLCPPVPGRSDYVHHLADLLVAYEGDEYSKLSPKQSATELKNSCDAQSKNKVKRCLDIGVGANCIYPIVGVSEYGWSFVGTDIDPDSLASANQIIAKNPSLADNLELRLQRCSEDVFKGIIKKGEKFDCTMCNPPFHSSKEDADKGTVRKIKNLKGEKSTSISLNFGGTSNELWCQGGEVGFVNTMITQSAQYANASIWFTTLISKESSLKHAYRTLKEVNPTLIKLIPMSQGQKQSRILAWSFQVKEKGKRTQ